MPNKPSPPDEQPASYPQHQSFWFPAASDSGLEGSPDELVSDLVEIVASAATTAMSGLGWKAPSRVRVPIFQRDAAPENTTPAAAEENPVPTGAVRDDPPLERDPATPGVYDVSGSPDELKSLARAHAEGIRVLSAPREPTANDETVRLLREHIVPNPMPPDFTDDGESATSIFRDRQIAAGLLATAGLPSGASADEEIVEDLRAAPPDDHDFLEVARAPAPSTTLTVDFLDMDNPPKGAEAAHAPSCAVQVDRDDATPNDGAVPQGIQVGIGGGNDDTFSCALWSNGRFMICPSDGVPVLLNKGDARVLLRYVAEVLSASARAAT